MTILISLRKCALKGYQWNGDNKSCGSQEQFQLSMVIAINCNHSTGGERPPEGISASYSFPRDQALHKACIDSGPSFHLLIRVRISSGGHSVSHIGLFW